MNSYLKVYKEGDNHKKPIYRKTNRTAKIPKPAKIITKRENPEDKENCSFYQNLCKITECCSTDASDKRYSKPEEEIKPKDDYEENNEDKYIYFGKYNM